MVSNKLRKKVAVIGAGPGGLTSAMLLAYRGFDVVLLEKSDRVGGRNAELKVDDYSFDTGPTFLHQKFTLDEVFLEAGRNSEDYIDFVKLDPMTRLSWGDTSLDTSFEIDRMAENVEQAFPGQADGYRRYMDEHAAKLKAIYPCLLRPYHKLSTLLSPTLLKAFPHVATNSSVVDVLDQYFDDLRLQLAFTFQAKYLGMSPWKCPALFSILSYIEYRFGIYHVQGGLCKISEAMAKVIEEEGGEIRLNSPVKQLHYNGSRVSSVELEGGEKIPVDDVVVNADYANAMRTIMGDRCQTDNSLKKKKFSCSTFMLYLGLDKLYQDAPHHHILFADDYRTNVSEIQSEQTVSDDMSVYVRNSSVTDPHVAPEGHSGIYVLVPTINNRHEYDWETNTQAYRNKILDRIEQRTTFKNIRDHIVAERIITPVDWQNRDIYMGATFNLTHSLDQMLYFRPHNRFQNFQNLYLVGGGTHPGSGLPTIYESARISSNLISDNRNVPYQRVDIGSSLL
ncbi:MAG: phytoene desaturase family protein [Verrucomicrobiota bacterium]